MYCIFICTFFAVCWSDMSCYFELIAQITKTAKEITTSERVGGFSPRAYRRVGFDW